MFYEIVTVPFFVENFTDLIITHYALSIKHYALDLSVFLFKVFFRFGLLEIFRI